MQLDILRRAVEHNAEIIEQLHDAYDRRDYDAVVALLAELDLNAADLQVALEELAALPPTGPQAGEVTDDGRGGSKV